MKNFQIKHILFLMTLLFLFNACQKKQEQIEVVPIEVLSGSDIFPISDSLVIPYQYYGQILLDSFSIDERKEKFIALMLPSILISKFQLDQNYNRFLSIIEKDTSDWKGKEFKFIESLLHEYKTTDTAELKSRLLSHPVCIILAQAAMESAWGTSRFFKEANNPFGIWSFNKDEPRISSKVARDEGYVYLRKYDNLQESIDDYLKTIARGPYKEFRKARIKTTNPDILVPELINYSEKKSQYTNELSIIIKKNKLTRFDHYTVHPDYIK